MATVPIDRWDVSHVTLNLDQQLAYIYIWPTGKWLCLLILQALNAQLTYVDFVVSSF